MLTSRNTATLLIFILGLTGLAGVGLTFVYQLACEGQLVNVNYEPAELQQIWGDQVISQSFVAPHNRLNRFDLILQNYGRHNTQDVVVRLLELPGSDGYSVQGTEIFSATFNANTVRDQDWHTFTFPEIPDSAGKGYLISLQSPTSTPGNAITVGGIDKDIYPLGTAFLGPVRTPADISFRACFQMSMQEKIQLLAQQITRERPGWWGHPSFYLLSLLLYSVLLVIFFWQLTRFVKE